MQQEVVGAACIVFIDLAPVALGDAAQMLRLPVAMFVERRKAVIPIKLRPSIAMVKSGSPSVCPISRASQAFPSCVCKTAKTATKDSATHRAQGPAHEAILPRYASEGLAEADIDLDRGIGAALVQRRRQVEPQRPERSVIARPYAYAVKQRAAELRHRALVIAAGINKRNDADRFGDLDAGFQVEH